MSVEAGDYGVVYIEKGKYRGKLGFYDDDDSGGIVVYLSTPFATPYIIVRRSSVRPATEKEAKEWQDRYNSESVAKKNWDRHMRLVKMGL